MRPGTVALSLLFLSAAGTAGAQEPVFLRLGGRIGEVVHSRLVLNTFVRGGPMATMGGDTTLPTMRMTMYMTSMLSAIAGDTLSLTGAVDSAQVESPGMPEFASMLQGTAATARRHTTVRADRRGRVFSIDTAGAAIPGAPSGSGVGGFMGTTGTGPEGFVFPEGAVRVGQSWADSSSLVLPQSGAQIRTRHQFRLVRIEPRGDSGTAMITTIGTVTMPMPFGTTDSPFAGIMAFDIAAHRVTAAAFTTVYRAETPMGEMTTRAEMTQTEAGDTALTVPRIRISAPAAGAPPRPAAPVGPPQPGAAPAAAPSPPATPADTQVGVEISPAPGRFTVIRLGTPEGQLNALLAEHVRRARAAGRRPFVEFEADWCGPCKSLQRYLGDRRMVDAFDGTYIVKVNSDRWMARLAGTGFDASLIPVFYELDDAGRPTGRKIDGGAWGEDVPENMAPPLKAFFHPDAASGR